jgi:uncharacterized protein YjbJ (UPF0337 family)
VTCLLAEMMAVLLRAERSRNGFSNFLASGYNLENLVMDKDRIAGSAKAIKGSVKETIGKATGDAELQAAARRTKLKAKFRMPLVAPRTQ